MRVKLLIAAVAVALTATSCMTISKTSQSRASQARIAQANAEIIVINPTAKVNVEPTRITDEWVYQGTDLNDFKTGLATDIKERLMLDATSKTLKKHNGDILVAPLIDVVSTMQKGVLKSYTVSVSGYIGKFCDWDKDGITLPIDQSTTPEEVERVRVSVSTFQ